MKTYKMVVTIESPEKDKTKTYVLECTFMYDEKQYGNGYYLSIEGEEVYGWYYDLRYDTSFDSREKEDYLRKWAYAYWSGKNGAWHVVELVVEEEK